MEWLIGLFVVWLISQMSGSSSSTTKSSEAKKEKTANKKRNDDLELEQMKRARERARKLKELQTLERFPARETSVLEEPTQDASCTPIIPRGDVAVPTGDKVAHEIRAEDWSRGGDYQAHCGEFSNPGSSISTQFRGGVDLKEEKNDSVAPHFQVFGLSSLWHITHRDNLINIFDKGILSNSRAYSELRPVDISNHEVQRRRDRADPFYNRAIHDYAPLYVNPRNPMLYVKKDLQHELCVLEVSLSALDEVEFLFTDGNAASRDTRFYKDVKDLAFIPWDVIRADYWNDYADGKRKRCAEVLVFPHVAPRYIVRVHCLSMETLRIAKGFGCDAVVSKGIFF